MILRPGENCIGILEGVPSEKIPAIIDFCRNRQYNVHKKGGWNLLERMDAFFESRLEGYDVHMLTDIESAGEFYPATAHQLPGNPGCSILDLGCGTGLELEFYFQGKPSAEITGIDLSAGMLAALKEKFPGKDITLVQGSYFDVPFGVEKYDAAVSVESLHHFTGEEKLPLYAKLRAALKPGGFFVLTDYFALSDQEERMHRRNLLELKLAQGICDDEFYHYDTPLTVAHETEVLLKAGFSRVKTVSNWGATYLLKAFK